MKIHVLDLHYLGAEHSIASFVIESSDGPILIETGPGNCTERLVDGLAAIGYLASDVHHVFLTHIHLDHAGAAGFWAQLGAKVYVHQRGAKHIIDPSRLLASAARIYGDQMQHLFGDMVPAPESNVHPLTDRDEISIGDVTLCALDTPGHAKHHMAFAVNMTDSRCICFAGDVAAMTVPGTRFISLPMPPPEFELDDWIESLDRMSQMQFARLYLTHFGPVEEPSLYLARVRSRLMAHADFIRNAMEHGKKSEEDIRAEYGRWVRSTALEESVVHSDLSRHVTNNLISMSVSGVMRYWSRKMQPVEQP